MFSPPFSGDTTNKPLCLRWHGAATGFHLKVTGFGIPFAGDTSKHVEGQEDIWQGAGAQGRCPDSPNYFHLGRKLALATGLPGGSSPCFPVPTVTQAQLQQEDIFLP